MKILSTLVVASLAAIPFVMQIGGNAHAEVAKAVSVNMPSEEKKGFWWKKEPPPEVESAEVDKDVEYKDLPPPPTDDELVKMHPRQVEKLISDYKAYAVWKVTPEAVGWYFDLQDFARRRSLAFTSTTELVMLQRPDLNINTSYPTTVPGRDARLRTREATLTSRLAADRQKAALVLLSRKGCEFCQAQRAALKYFQEKHGWEIKEVDIEERPDLAAKFATDYVPTTILIFRNSSDWQPVSIGVEAVPKIEEGVYRSLRLQAGETTHEQFIVKEEEDGGVFDPTRRLK